MKKEINDLIFVLSARIGDAEAPTRVCLVSGAICTCLPFTTLPLSRHAIKASFHSSRHRRWRMQMEGRVYLGSSSLDSLACAIGNHSQDAAMKNKHLALAGASNQPWRRGWRQQMVSARLWRSHTSSSSRLITDSHTTTAQLRQLEPTVLGCYTSSFTLRIREPCGTSKHQLEKL